MSQRWTGAALIDRSRHPTDNTIRVNAITVRLPFAAAVRAGAKLVENRGRPVAFRHIGQPVAVHAAAAWSQAGAVDGRVRNWWWGSGWHVRRPLEPADFAPMFRTVLAVATLTGCHQAVHEDGKTCCGPFADRFYGDGFTPAWHLTFSDVTPLEVPVGPVKGQLSVPWTLPAETAEQVAAQLAGKAS